jgi:hypothetical protein
MRALKSPHGGVLGIFVNLFCRFVDFICGFVDPTGGLVDLLGILVNTLLQRRLSRTLDGFSDRVRVPYLIIRNRIS